MEGKGVGDAQDATTLGVVQGTTRAMLLVKFRTVLLVKMRTLMKIAAMKSFNPSKVSMLQELQVHMFIENN